MRNTIALYGLLVAGLFIVGCGDDSGAYKESKKGKDVEAEKEAPPPHGGHLVHLEPHHAVHLELTFDADARKATIYVIEEKDEKWEPYSLEAEMLEFHQELDGKEAEIEFKAVRADGETTASEFVAEGDALPTEIEDEEDFAGHVHLEIDGKKHVGDIDHEGHVH